MRIWNAERGEVHWHSVLVLVLTSSSLSAAAGGGFDRSCFLQTRVETEPVPLETVERHATGLHADISVRTHGTSTSAKHRQTLFNHDDVQYVASFTAGNTPMKGIVDTGSFDLLIFPSYCSTCGTAGSYDPSSSRTHELGTYSLSQSFGSGETVSYEAYEQVEVGPLVSAHQIFWEVQSARMPILEHASFNSILGMGPPETPAADYWVGAQTSVDAVVSGLGNSENEAALSTQEDVASQDVTAAMSMTSVTPLLRSFAVNTFSICMGYESGTDGVVVWNDDAADKSPEIFDELPVVGRHTWTVALHEPHLSLDASLDLLEKRNFANKTVLDAFDRVRKTYQSRKPPEGSSRMPEYFGTGDGLNITGLMMDALGLNLASSEVSGLADAFSPLGCSEGCGALLDSGTSLLAVPASVSGRLQSAVDALGADCSDLSKFPDLVLTLGNFTLSLPPDAYLAHSVDAAIPEHLASLVRSRSLTAATSGSGSCEVLIMETSAMTDYGELFILGSPFFRKYYTSFTVGESRGQRKVRVASAGPDCEPAARTSAPTTARTVPKRKIDLAKMYVDRSVLAAHTMPFVRI